MKKLILIFTVLIFCFTNTLFSQDDYQNLLKYWYYRDRLKNFVVPGEKQGESEMAGTRNQMGEGSQYHLNIDFGQHGVYFGYYLGVLATEYNILNNNQKYQDASNTKQELLMAMGQFTNFLDNCEHYWNSTKNIDGFFIRNDVPSQFLSLTNSRGRTDSPIRFHIDLLNENLNEEDNHWDETTHTYGVPAGHPGYCNLTLGQRSDTTNPQEENFAMSQDEAIGVLMGLALIYKCGPEDFNIRDTAKSIAYRIIKKISDPINGCDWIINDPVGQNVPLGYNAQGFAYGFAAAGSRFFGFDDLEFFCYEPVQRFNAMIMWQLLQFEASTVIQNNSMEATLAAIGDSWYETIWNLFWGFWIVNPNVTWTDDGIYHVTGGYNWESFYELLYRTLHPEWNIHDQYLNTALNQLSVAPCEGPYHYGGNYKDTNGWAYSYKWRGDVNEQNGNISQPTMGNFFGGDYMLLYNMYILALGNEMPGYHPYKDLYLIGDWPRQIESNYLGTINNPCQISAFKTLESNSRILNMDPSNLSGLPGDVTYKTEKCIKLKPGFAVESGAKFIAKIIPHVLCEDFSLNPAFDLPNGLLNNNISYVYKNMATDNVNYDKDKEISKGENSYKVFPNPSSSEITITFNGEIYLKSILEIWDLKNCLIFKREINNKSTKINISNVSPGIYLVKIYNSQSVFVTKLIKS